MDSKDEEQARGITMKSSSISLLFVPGAALRPEGPNSVPREEKLEQGEAKAAAAKHRDRGGRMGERQTRAKAAPKQPASRWTASRPAGFVKSWGDPDS